jgi:hypothetical protein
VTVDGDGGAEADPFAGVAGRMKKVNKEWKGKSFLRDV